MRPAAALLASLLPAEELELVERRAVRGLEQIQTNVPGRDGVEVIAFTVVIGANLRERSDENPSDGSRQRRDQERGANGIWNVDSARSRRGRVTMPAMPEPSANGC